MSENQPPQKTKRRYRVKPTEKQAKAMDLIAKGVPPTHAMKQAGYSEETSQAPGRNLLSRTGAITIQELISEAYLQVGVTPLHYTEGVRDLMGANKVVSARITGKDADSQTDDFIEVPDYQARAKGLELYRKDQGMDNQTNLTQNNVTVNFGDLKSKYKKENE